MTATAGYGVAAMVRTEAHAPPAAFERNVEVADDPAFLRSVSKVVEETAAAMQDLPPAAGQQKLPLQDTCTRQG